MNGLAHTFDRRNEVPVVVVVVVANIAKETDNSSRERDRLGRGLMASRKRERANELVGGEEGDRVPDTSRGNNLGRPERISRL